MNRTHTGLRFVGISLLTLLLSTGASGQTFRHVSHSAHTSESHHHPAGEEATEIETLSATEIFDTIIPTHPSSDFVYSSLIGPWVLMGYRYVPQVRFEAPVIRYDQPVIIAESDSISAEAELPAADMLTDMEEAVSIPTSTPTMSDWLSQAMSDSRTAMILQQTVMSSSPGTINYLYSQLPEAPQLPPEDNSFHQFLKRLDISVPDPTTTKMEVEEIEKRHWLHVFNAGLHFSQAYVSPNWYQGGNNHLALLINVLWDVSLNQVFHPNQMFQNTVSYKLSLNSNPKEQLHKYNISEDIFQWNLKAGIKAFRKWFYSFTLQFKTQFLCNYPADSWTRTASFLSPSDLNLGLGMTYSTTNKNKTLKFVASISPISYNLRTCIDPRIDPTQFNIKPGHKTSSEIGSTAELTLDWKWASNIGYTSRLFLFSDYTYFLTDWENTISFTINRFLSTQIYVHLRYDTSSDASLSKWKHLMLKEILSFGFTYNFSTK